MVRNIILFGILLSLTSAPANGQPWSMEEYALRTRQTPSPLRPTGQQRFVDGIPVPPFGFTFEPAADCIFSQYEGYFYFHLQAWPEPLPNPEIPLPLRFDKWSGPYRNAAGKKWVSKINEWYQNGAAAGLTQDTFRSFDNDHSSIPANCFPQMHTAPARPTFGSVWENIICPRITMGVQSYGKEGKSVIESRSQEMLRTFYATGFPDVSHQQYYRAFYENNVLFAAPAVGSYKPGNDAFSFLSPFYLHSIGASGTDAKLLKPFLLASAALPPDLKTRLLRNGLFTPTLLYLFKSNIVGDIKSPDAHVPAYDLPAEAAEDFDGPAPFLDGMLNAAHNLTHIPPVCRLKIESDLNETEPGHDYKGRAYQEDNTYGFTGALRQGQEFVLNVDLRFSWTDSNRPITAYYVSILRGKGTIEPLERDASVLKITIPWGPTDNRQNLRTDVLLLVNDGAYFSAPAYISVRHIHRLDPITLNIKSQSVNDKE